MASSTRTRKSGGKSQEKDFVARLADAGEDALQRLAELPGGHRALSAFNELRSRVDDLGRKMRGVEELEERVAELERQVAELQPAPPASAFEGSTKRASS